MENKNPVSGAAAFLFLLALIVLGLSFSLDPKIRDATGITELEKREPETPGKAPYDPYDPRNSNPNHWTNP